MRWIHIACGLTALVSGAMALSALKGAWLHRRSGTVFVYSMLVMASTGALLAFLRQPPGPGTGNMIGGLLTFYLVATAMLTVRRPRHYALHVDILATSIAVTIGIICIGFGISPPVAPAGVEN